MLIPAHTIAQGWRDSHDDDDDDDPRGGRGRGEQPPHRSCGPYLERSSLLSGMVPLQSIDSLAAHAAAAALALRRASSPRSSCPDRRDPPQGAPAVQLRLRPLLRRDHLLRLGGGDDHAASAPDRLRLRPRGWADGDDRSSSPSRPQHRPQLRPHHQPRRMGVAEKRLALLVSMFALFAVFTVSLRVTELRSFAVLIVVLATLTALGTIYEEKTDDNLFYSTATTSSAGRRSRPGAKRSGRRPVRPGEAPDLGADPARALGRLAAGDGGPLRLRVRDDLAGRRRRKLLWGLVACLIVAGALITQRRSGLVVPAVAIVALFAIRPRKMLPLFPWHWSPAWSDSSSRAAASQRSRS